MKIFENFQGLNKFKQMRWLYGLFLVLMVFVSACAQQTEPVAPPSAPEPSPAPAPEPEPEADTDGTGAAVAPQEKAETVNEVRYAGSGGFDPKELTISAGSAVTWINSDSKAGGLLIFKDGRSFTNSGRLAPDGKFEYEFTEAGVYDFWWNLAYGAVSGKLTVE